VSETFCMSETFSQKYLIFPPDVSKVRVYVPQIFVRPARGHALLFCEKYAQAKGAIYESGIQSQGN